jgi:hypothetical protein
VKTGLILAGFSKAGCGSERTVANNNNDDADNFSFNDRRKIGVH